MIVSRSVASWVALAWGFAEATLFFIVPDVWLSYVARERVRPGVVAALYALAGALAGGALMYAWGSADALSALRTVELLPAIDRVMIDRVGHELTEHGLLAIFWGPLSGTPYKLYALHAATHGWSLSALLLVSVPARLLRFLLIVMLAHYALRVLARVWPTIKPVPVLVAAWLGFYVFYFTVMPG